MAVDAADTPPAPEAFALSIDRQPLDGALQQLARQCSVQMIFFSRVTEGLSAPAIEGDYTVAAAMERLLSGSGLTFRLINPQTVEVRPLRARSSDSSRVRAIPAVSQSPGSSNEAAHTPLEEVVVVGLAEQLVATRIATPLRDIPQTVSIVTSEQIRQRNNADLADVLAYAPGITLARDNSLDVSFYARAYEINSLHIDGGAALQPKFDANMYFFSTPDLVEFDHVEILRGADGLFTGDGNPGGTISLVRKRPQRNFALAFNTTTGSWDSRRVEIDITGPLALDGALRGRAAAVYADDGYFYDIEAHEKEKIFAALEYDFTASATLTAGLSYQWDKASPIITGLPLYADGQDSHLPRDTALVPDWAGYRSDLGGLYLQYRHQLGPDWEVKLNASGWRAEVEYELGRVQALIDPATNTLNSRLAMQAEITTRPNVHSYGTVDVTATGTLNWLGWREEVAIGADFTRSRSRSDFKLYSDRWLGDPRAFDPSVYPDPRAMDDFWEWIGTSKTLEQYGMFTSLRIYFDEAWSIVGGARVSRDSRRSQSSFKAPPFPATYTAKQETGPVTTPYAGLMYAFNRHYSLYASYADIYLAQQTRHERSPGNPLDEPIRGVNIEAGIKSEWRNGAINGALAVYRIKQSNLPVLVSSEQTTLRGQVCCYGGVSSRSKGMDVELSGELSPGWSIGTGYSYNENESPTGEALSTITPKHLFKAWTNVRLHGAFSRWQVGGSLHAQSRTTRHATDTHCPAPTFVCVPVDAVQPKYAVLDLRAAFDIDRNWQVALRLNNALDEVYYESIESDLHAWYGPPRNWMLRIDGRY